MKYKEIQTKNVDLISVAKDMVQWLALILLNFSTVYLSFII